MGPINLGVATFVVCIMVYSRTVSCESIGNDFGNGYGFLRSCDNVISPCDAGEIKETGKFWFKKIKNFGDNSKLMTCATPGYNQYGTEVTAFFVKDENGKLANKIVAEEGKKVVLHGVWPTDVCVETPSGSQRIEMMPLLNDEVEVIKQKIDMCIKSTGFGELFGKLAKTTIDFYYGEYKRHFYQNGYTVDTYCEGISQAVKNFGFGRWNLFYPHDLRVNQSTSANFLEQIVYIGNVKNVKNWNYKKTTMKSKIFVNPIDYNEFEEIPFCFNSLGKNECTYDVNRLLNDVKSYLNNDMLYDIVNVKFVRNVVNKMSEIKENIDNKNWQYFLTQSSILMSSGSTIAVQYVNKIKVSEYDFNFGLPDDFYLRLLTLVGLFVIIGTALVLFSWSFTEIVAELFIISVFGWLFNCVFNIFKKYHRQKTIISILFGLFVWLSINVIMYNELYISSFDGIVKGHNDSEVVLDTLEAVGFSNVVEISKIIVNLDWNMTFLYWYITYIIMPSIMIATYFRKLVTYVTACNLIENQGKHDVKKMNYSIAVHVFSIVLLIVILSLNYDIHSSEFKDKILVKLRDEGDVAVYEYVAMLSTKFEFFSWINMDNFASHPVYVLAILLLIALCIEIISDLSLGRFKFIRVSEIGLFVLTIIYQYKNISNLGIVLYMSLNKSNDFGMVILVNYCIFLVATVIAQLWSQSTSIFFLMSEFLVIFPLVVKVCTIEFFGIKDGINKILMLINKEDCVIEAYLLITLGIVLYITHVSFKLYRIHRYIQVNRNFLVEDRAWKKTFNKIFASTLKIFTALIMVGYTTQFFIPLTGSSFAITSKTWFVLAGICIVTWSFTSLFSVFSSYHLVYKTEFGSHKMVKIIVYMLCTLSCGIVLPVQIVMLSSIYQYFYHIGMVLQMVSQLVPNFFMIVMVAYVQAWITPLCTKLMYWMCKEDVATPLFAFNWFRSALLSLTNMLQWGGFITFMYKTSIIVYNLYISLGGPWYGMIGNIFGIWCSLALVLVAVDVQCDIVRQLMEIALSGLKFRKYVKYQRLEEDINGIREVDSLYEEVDIRGDRFKIWDYLTTGNIRTFQTKRLVTSGCSNKSFSVSAQGGVAELGVEAEIEMVNGNVIRANVDPENIQLTNKVDESGERVTEEFGRYLDNEDFRSKLEDLELITSCKFVECGVHYCLEEERNKICGIGTAIVSKDMEHEIINLTRSNVLYWPSFNLFNEAVNIQKTGIACQSVSCLKPVLAASNADIYHKIGQLQKPPYCDVNTILVEEQVDLGMETFQIIPNTPFNIVRNLLEKVCNISTMAFSNRVVHENGSVNVLCELKPTDLFAEKYLDEYDDNIYTFQEYIVRTGLTVEKIWHLVKDNKIWLVCNSVGRVFVTTNPQVGAQLFTGNVKDTDKRELRKLSACELKQKLCVKPFIITSHHTMATDSNPNAFSVEWDAGTLVLFNDELRFYISTPMDLSNYNGIKVRDAVDSNVILQKTLAFSTGLVYAQEGKKLSEHHLGSCSVIKHPNKDELYVLTNQHIASEVYQWSFMQGTMDGCQKVKVISKNGDKVKKEMKFKKNLVCVLGLEKKIVVIEMNKLVAMGFDYCLFKLDNPHKKMYVDTLAKILKKNMQDTWTHIPVLGKFSDDAVDPDIGMKGVCMLSSVRQTDRPLDKDKSIVQLRMTLLRWHIGDRLWELMGYASAGMSGSPLWRLETDKNNVDRLIQVGMVSAVERNSWLTVHMTNFIITEDLVDMLNDVAYNDNNNEIVCPEKWFGKTAAVECRTSRLQRVDKNIQSANWYCKLQDIDVEQKPKKADFSRNEEIGSKFDQLFCSQAKPKCKTLNSQLKKLALQPYWKIYDDFGDHLNFTSFSSELWDDIMKHVTINDEVQQVDKSLEIAPAEIINNCEIIKSNWKFDQLMTKFKRAYDNGKNIIVSFHNGSSYLFVHWLNKQKLGNKIEIPDTTFGFMAGFWSESDGIFFFNKIHEKIPVLTVDVGFVLEVIRACHWYISIDEWLNQLQSIVKDGEEIVSVNRIDNRYFLELYRKTGGELIKDHEGIALDDLKGKIGFMVSQYSDIKFCNNSWPIFDGFFQFTDNEDVGEQLNALARDMIAIRKQEAQANQSVQRLKNLINDIKQSDEYQERKRKWDDAMARYNKEKLEHASDIKVVQDKMREISQELRSIDLEYANKIKKLKVKKQTLDDSKQILKNKNKEQIEQKIKLLEEQAKHIRDQITEKKKQLDELEKKKRDIKAGNTAQTKVIDVQIQKIKDQIKKLEDDKSAKKEVLRKRKDELNSSIKIVERPSADLNPENDPILKEKMDEIIHLRGEIKMILNEKSNIQKKLDDLTIIVKDNQKQSVSVQTALKAEISRLTQLIENELCFRASNIKADGQTQKKTYGVESNDGANPKNFAEPKPQRPNVGQRGFRAIATTVQLNQETHQNQALADETKRKPKGNKNHEDRLKRDRSNQKIFKEDGYERKIEEYPELEEDIPSGEAEKKDKRGHFPIKKTDNHYELAYRPDSPIGFNRTKNNVNDLENEGATALAPSSTKTVTTSRSSRISRAVLDRLPVVDFDDLTDEEKETWLKNLVSDQQFSLVNVMFRKFKGVLTFYRIKGRLPNRNDKEDLKWGVFFLADDRNNPTKKMVLYLDSVENIDKLWNFILKAWEILGKPKPFTLPNHYANIMKNLREGTKIQPAAHRVFEIVKHCLYKIENEESVKELRIHASLGSAEEWELQQTVCENTDDIVFKFFQRGRVVPDYIKKIFDQCKQDENDKFVGSQIDESGKSNAFIALSVPKLFEKDIAKVVNDGSFLGYPSWLKRRSKWKQD